MEFEKPGAHTPWPGINRLLLLDERFEARQHAWQGYLFVPRNLSRLSALMYALKELQLSFHVQDRLAPEPCAATRILISMRAFKAIRFSNQRIEVEAGCTVNAFQSALLEHGLEIEEREDPKGTMRDLILRGGTSVIGADFMKLDGGILRWHPYAAGPALHQLIGGADRLPAILLKGYFKGRPIPRSRLRLAWAFSQREELWTFIRSLKRFASSWEKLDCILPGKSHEKAFILAQISGTEKEMAAFKIGCPRFNKALLDDSEAKIKHFFLREKFHFVPVSFQGATHEVGESAYLWYQALANQGWLVTKEAQARAVTSDWPAWKEKLYECL